MTQALLKAAEHIDGIENLAFAATMLGLETGTEADHVTGALEDVGLADVAATRVIRLRTIQKSSEAATWGNSPNQTDFATVLVSMGGNDDILVFSYGGWTSLVQRAKGNAGGTLETIGRLMQMRGNHPAWKKYCGLAELSPQPRWLFEEESP